MIEWHSYGWIIGKIEDNERTFLKRKEPQKLIDFDRTTSTKTFQNFFNRLTVPLSKREQLISIPK